MGKRHAVFIEIHGPRFSYHMAMRLFWHGCSILSTRLGIPLYHRLHCVVGQGMYTIQTAIEVEKRRDEEEQKTWYLENFGQMSLLDIYSSNMTGSIRRTVIKELLHAGASDEVIKDIVHPKFSEDQVIQKKKMWMEMSGKIQEHLFSSF